MFKNEKILIGSGENEVFLLPSMANRHGLICGATGTGKTVTLKVLAESFSDMGVPVFLADIKGDLSGCIEPGEASEAIKKRLSGIGIDPESFEFKRFPVRFWDVFGEKGHPVRTTVSRMGPELLSRLLGLTPAQCVMVGDSDNDAIGAEGIGCPFIGVTYGFGFESKEDVMEFKNIGIASTPAEIFEIING